MTGETVCSGLMQPFGLKSLLHIYCTWCRWPYVRMLSSSSHSSPTVPRGGVFPAVEYACRCIWMV